MRHPTPRSWRASSRRTWASRQAAFEDLIDEFLSRKSAGELATDELLNAIFLRYSGLRPAGETAEQLADIVMPYLDKLPG